jgi:hypothetical protein
MSSQNWTTLIDHIKGELGADVLPLEIDDERIVNIIKTQVIPNFSIYDGIDTYLELAPVTEEDLVRVSKNALFKITGNTSPIVKVIEMLNTDAFQSDLDLIDIEVSATNMVDMLIDQNYQDMKDLFRATDSWEFIPPKYMRIIRPYGDAEFNNQDLLIAKVRLEITNLFEISPTMYEMFKDMATAEIMGRIGKIRSKYEDIQTPFGSIRMNGQMLVQESREMKMKIDQDLTRIPPEKYLLFI